jgi:hypothetical protein
MPVFDFANEWRDIYFRETGNKPDASAKDSDGRGTGSTKPVLSFYFWIYLIVSVSLTAVTIFGWWRYTRTTRHPPKPKHKRISYTGGTKRKSGKFISFMPEYEGGKDSV